MTEKTRPSAAPTSGSDEIDIGRLVGTVIEAKWWVLGITAIFAVAAIVYTLFATPIYSADALVQIEQNTGNSLVQDIGSGQQAASIGSRNSADPVAPGTGQNGSRSGAGYRGHQKHLPGIWRRLGSPDGAQ